MAVRTTLRSLMKTSLFRLIVGRCRLRWALMRGRLRNAESETSIKETIQHNLRSLKNFTNARIELLIRPLSVIESARSPEKVLIIGPRNENDLLLACGYFNIPLNRIRGLDLISYSELIDIGDMHAMPYDDNSFDVVICGWTVSYSEQPQVLANEMVRVCKDNGVIAVGVEYSTLSDEDYEKILGYSLNIPGMDRINSVEQLQGLFKAALKDIHFEHDAPLKRSHTANGRIPQPSNVATIFSIVKG